MQTKTIPADFFDKVKRAYSGRDGCACGCRGTYYDPEHKSFPRMVKKIRALFTDPTNADDVEVLVDADEVIVSLVRNGRLYFLRA